MFGLAVSGLIGKNCRKTPANTQVDARAVYQNSKKEAIAGGAEDSIVFKNPEAEASFSSLPGSENDFTKLSEAREPELSNTCISEAKYS